MSVFTAYFGNEYIEVFATDVGNWEMELTNTDGKIYKFRGSLCSEFEIEGVDLSDLVRSSLNMPELYVFDGNSKTKTINRIEIFYHRITKIKPKMPVPENEEYMTWNCTESGIETVFEFMRFYGWGEIMNPAVYGRVRRCNKDFIYCSVVFEEGYKRYYYIADDDSIEVDDFVLVPAEKDNHEAIVQVVEKEYFTEDKVPLPLEKTKHIICKCTEDDIDLLDS